MSSRVGGVRSLRRLGLVVALLSLLLAVGSGAAVAAEIPLADLGSSDETDQPSVDPKLEDADGETTVIVEFESIGSDSSGDATQPACESTQRGFERYADETDGVTVEQAFWIADAAVVTVDADRIAFAELADREGVAAIRAEEMVASEASGAQSSTIDLPETATETYAPGLEQLRVPEVWETYQTRGDGASVAVLDSGVEGDHPDLEVAKWNDFGDSPADDPVAYDDHGTHVSGVVAGGNESGTHIGVTPDADLYHGAVMTDCEDDNCVGYDRHIIAGIEWAVEEDANVIVMSLGQDGYGPTLIDAIESANDAGTLVVGSIGNGGEGASTSPGNIYDATSVGAVDESGSVTGFSGSQEIDTRNAWGDDAPAHWPSSYGVPTVTAPGVDVKSTVPGGNYEEKTGTSMAAPHVAGAAALVQSATAADLEPATIEAALVETAADSDGQNEHTIDAAAAVEEAGSYATLEGTVTDAATGEPVADASVTATNDETERKATTDEDGTFEFDAVYGDRSYDVTTERDGYERDDETVFVSEDEVADLDVELEGDAAIEMSLTDEQFGDDVEGATVRAVGPDGEYSTSDAADGTYRLESVPGTGEYDLRVNATGYVDRERTVTIGGGDRLSESVALAGDSTLEIAAETETGTPIENATVAIERDAGLTFEPDERTNESGTLEVPVAGTGERYTVVVSAAEFETATGESTAIAAGASEEMTVILPERGLSTPSLGVLAAAFAVVVVGAARFVQS
jgi:serine protease AprX